MRRTMAALVEERTDIVEIDDVQSSYSASLKTTEVREETDPFKKTGDFAKLPKRVQNRILKRQYSGTDGTESKYLDPEQYNGYGMFDVVEPPYNLDILASLFEESSTVNACVMARTMNTVGLGYVWEDTTKAKKRTERAAGKDTAQRVRDEHQKEEDRLNDLFDSFNTDDSFSETLIKIWVDVLTTGNGYMEIGRNKRGQIAYVGHIPSILVRVRRQRDGFLQRAMGKYVFFRNFQDTTYPDPVNNDPDANEIIHFKLYTPNNTYYGVPPSIAAMSAIIGDKFAKEYNIDYFENKSIPRYAIILKGAKLSQKSKQEIINYFRNEIKGNNHGTLFVPLPATLGKDVDLKFESLEDKVQEGSFDKYRKSNRDEITVAYRVPAPKIGIYDNANLAVSRDADKTFKSQVTEPDQSGAEKKINKIVKEFSDLKRFKFDEIDILDEDLRSRIYDRYLRTEVITPNEVRAKIGLTALEGEDEVLPYPAKVQDKNVASQIELNEWQIEHSKQSLKLQQDAAKNGAPMPGQPGQPNAGGKEGAPIGGNPGAGSPPKSAQDAANKQGTPVDQTKEGRADRGAKQQVGGK